MTYLLKYKQSWRSWEVPNGWRKANPQKRPKGQPGKLQEEQPHFCPWKNHGLSPLGKHFWTYERKDSDWGTVSMNLPDQFDHVL